MSEKVIDKVFVEYGLDFDNNKFGLGKSIEVEYTDDTEDRMQAMPCAVAGCRSYFRIWIYKTSFIFSKTGVDVVKKNRLNLKVIVGFEYKPVLQEAT